MLSKKTEEEIKSRKILSKPLNFIEIDCLEAYIENLE